ncbi:PREDICTED: uncharacterized protein LOC109227977 [Nicotiana attenuata]|uniref:uncharacterized protein LOC109227977 n=1 Tax=Nicotiana attenuata TaxID=49451 RepID=UPI0009050EAA|nr:PREDICTED: uncharacterized protein LOC109227977 [Nicotiana attenuata]
MHSTPSSSTYSSNPSSPLHLHSSDVLGSCLVTVPFSGTGYGGWKRSTVVSLSAKNKIAFIDRTCPKLPDNSPTLQQWNRCNNMVISRITNSLTPIIAESVQYSETAESILRRLESRYGAVNGTKVFELNKELAFTSQGSSDIASYFNKLKKLWDELEMMRKKHSNSCVCPAKSGTKKEEEEDKVHQFVMF